MRIQPLTHILPYLRLKPHLKLQAEKITSCKKFNNTGLTTIHKPVYDNTNIEVKESYNMVTSRCLL